jgi:serine O-acetyltransferase
MSEVPEGLLGDIKTLFSDRGTLQGKPDPKKAVQVVLTKPGVQALFFYRLYRRLYLSGFELTAEILARINYFLTGAEIDPGAEIGPGCHIWHAAGVTIGRGVRLGANVCLLHNVTLGGRGASPFNLGDEGYPEIGDNVILYTGVTVVGPVKIGDDAVIGAHSLVLESVPAGSLAYGIPAKVVTRG